MPADLSPLVAYEDPEHPGNGPAHHTGQPCIEPGCESPAGTAWSPYWCFGCNVARINRISASLSHLQARAEQGGPSDG